MIEAEDGEGLVFWREWDIVSLTPVYPERTRLVHKNGSVAYRPGPPPQGPWRPLGDSWVLPQGLREDQGQWLDPAGFQYPFQPLEPLPPEPLPLEPWPGLPCPSHQIWGFEAGDWLTDAGPRPSGLSPEEACRLHPDLRQANYRHYYNRQRLERLQVDYKKATLIYDHGQRHTQDRRQDDTLLHSLGLTRLDHLEPHQAGLFRYYLREYPFSIALAPAAVLKQHFRSAAALIANLLWQTLLYRRQGQALAYGTDHRDYWYKPLHAALSRAGLLSARGRDDADYDLYCRILATYVGEDRLFTFLELGFLQPRPELRSVGDRQPWCILVAEKISLAETVGYLASRYGLSTWILGGQPGLFSAEFFARALAEVYQGEVRIFAYVDVDHKGYSIGRTAAKHLARYGFLCPAGPTYLVRPESFTAEELELFASPLRPKGAAEKTEVERWVRETGGIHGEARGIFCNWLPLERVEAELVKVL